MIKRIGRHKVRHGDVHNSEGIDKLLEGVSADIYYTDPPWGSPTIKYFDTLNRKQNEGAGSTGNFDVDIFLKIILARAVEVSKGWVVVEYGKNWVDKVKQFADEAGLIFCGQVEALYANNLPLEIMFFRVDAYEDINLSSIYHLKGYKCTLAIFKLLRPTSGGVGVDLCCGMGFTAQACIDTGLSFVGNELNAARLEKTIARLNKDAKNKKLKFGSRK